MPSDPLDLETRIKTLNLVLGAKQDRQIVDQALRAANGDMPAALASLKDKLPEAALQRITLAHSLAVWSDDHFSVVKAISAQTDITSLHDVALRFNVDKLAGLVDPHSVPANTPGATPGEKMKNFAVVLQNKLFSAEPTAVLQRMVQDAEVPIADPIQRAGVGSFLTNQPEFNIRTTSIYTALQHPDAFQGIADEHRAGVVDQLKTLQRVQAISPVPAAVPVLMNANLTSAFRVAEMPESTFMNAHGPTLGEETARQVYTNAINTHIRNEHSLMTMREARRGTGLAIIDGQQPMEARAAKLQAVADAQAVPLNFETLFGSMDHCECDDCLSVYSPAAYFVEILQYLRNNDLGPDPTDPTQPNPGIRTDRNDISKTPLEKLFRRRPDLGCLELTCENTFTVLPYIDLVNEVMESFVVHLDKYHTDPNDPKQATLEIFNVTDETTSELLAQPQHINYQAYCILKDAVYPFTLPYHQPIDVIRIWLKYLGTSRFELLDTLRTATEAVSSGVVLTPVQQQQLQGLHKMVLDRSADAEFLGITQEEHIILTREAFWPKAYFDLTLSQTVRVDDYRTKIGVRPVHEYYGYETESDMLSIDETAMLGLTFVKKQFLPRTGIQYVDLVEMLKARFINPAYPEGQALALLESIRFSYRFLQSLLDPRSTDPTVRFAKLIAFLNSVQPLVPQIEAALHPDPCHQQCSDPCLRDTDFHNWVYCYFDRIGKLIVLESGEGPQLPIEGQLFTDDHTSPTLLGALHSDGTIADTNGKTIGHVGATLDITKDPPVVLAGPVGWTDGKRFQDEFPTSNFLLIKDETSPKPIGAVNPDGFLVGPNREQLLPWLPARDTCDLEKVRLRHLDGSVLLVDEYDRMQGFLRLWHKLGWTIAETDLALIGTSSSGAFVSTPGNAAMLPSGGGTVGFDIFQSDCSTLDSGDPGGCCDDTPRPSDGNPCPAIPQVADKISTDFLHQVVAIRKLLDLTGLPLDKLLSFWADINTSGESSLYSRLFLTHNLLAIDKVFKSDTNGNVLTQAAKISEHMPVLLAALKLKANDVAAIIKFRTLTDELTLANVSVLYRHSLFAVLLHQRVVDLPEVFALFGDPFKSPDDTLVLLRDWGNMEDAGFTFRQLNYLIRNQDDLQRPLAPSQTTILQVSKSLYDGLNAIDHDHPDVTAERKDDATADLIRAQAGLLYEASVVEQIVGLLEGTSIYSTSAPLNLVFAPDALPKKLKYANQNDPTKPLSASIQVTGLLTDAERALAKTLSNDSGWALAIDRVGKQAQQFFNDSLLGIFPNTADAVAHLLAGDINIPPDPKNLAATDANTAPLKRFYFLQYFLPFLRQRLAHQLIVGGLSSAASLATDVTDVLLTEILLGVEAGKHAIDDLEQIHQKPVASGDNWKGYLIPSIDGAYTFIAKTLAPDPQPPTQPPDLVIDGQSIPFSVQQLDPPNVWSTDPATPQKLKRGKLYLLEVHGQHLLEVNGQPPCTLQWKTTASPPAAIPASALLPDYSSHGTEEAFVKLFKAALVVNGFNLTADEVSYWQAHGADFAATDPSPSAAPSPIFDFNAILLGHWRRLQAYTHLRDKLPKTDTSLLNLFQWANKPDATTLSAKIAAATQWNPNDIAKLIAPEHFDLDRPDAFRNEVNLLTLQKALQVAGKIGADIDRLFAWANPISKFSVCHQIAEDIRATLRARYDQEDWEQVVGPLNDQLREDQKQALIGYLLVQQDLRDWGVVDADSLFEFFLIDVQMGACMQTSRIKQAISTVQLYIQRIFLGEEARYGVSNAALDRGRWDWMQKYRVWEANRKVFLYPENWIKSELRDDKSPFYKELESELLQKDINTQTVEDALKSYLFKVDEVANLKVVGLFLDEPGVTLHVFARTRNAPYYFFYRYFKTDESNWYPWESIQVDIPNYEVETVGKITDRGTYLIPVVWNKRLLLFFPQFMKKSVPTGAGAAVNEFWEIKLAWSEYRNGKWTQKQVSGDAVYDKELRDIHVYQFVPRLVTAPDRIVVDVFELLFDGKLGAFQFVGSQLSLSSVLGGDLAFTDFHYLTKNNLTSIYSLQATEATAPQHFGKEPYFTDATTSVTFNDAKVRCFHPFSHELLGTLSAGHLDDLFAYYAKNVTQPVDVADAYGLAGAGVYNELKRPYALYNWETAFHAPMLLVDRLLQVQQFDNALKMCHYVLTPYAAGTGAKRFWQFQPFKEIDAENVLEKLFLGLQPNTPDAPHGQIAEWRNKPFQPHVVARLRPSAYMKWVAMKYIEILIAYGDYYFRQNTLETIPLAIQCYVLASHVYGPRGQKIPKRGNTLPQTYNSLLDKWDAFGNAMVELELIFPFSNQTPFPVGMSNGVVGLANVFGFATTLYFCIPDNPQLTALRDTIDDRLFKIRHCQDIDGVVRHLPLFEPPIDPALLVQAAAQGLSLSSVLNDLNSPMSNYRFYYLLQKALELCGELKSLGNAFLSNKVNLNAESLSQLRARHESSIHNLVMEVKKQQLDEAGKSLDALQQSRKGPESRLTHYLALIGEVNRKVPTSAEDWTDLDFKIEAPVDETGLKVVGYEKEEMDKAAEANDRQEDVGRVEVLASILNILPNISVGGIGFSISFGGSNVGSAAQAIARANQVVVGNRTFSSTNAGRKANFLRQLQDRVQQANAAGYEIKNIDKQMLTQQIRINIAQQEITNQQKQIDNAQEVEEFLRNKYTNEELYSWMDGQIKSLYYQAYTLAYDLAKRAEKVFRFERGLSTSNFIQFGNWDIAHDGLLAGEHLYIGLKQLEAAYQEKRGHDYEISKSISLRQIDPFALIQLKETGSCEFALPEVLFDMDYPGHYMRRIKSVSLRIPCIVGPHTGLNCTLRLLEHKFRINPIVKGKGDYPEQTDHTDDRFSTVNVPISSIAVSSLESANGVFELNFHDERYLPFEGAGTISKWRLELPDQFKQFDYNSITEPAMQLLYTSVDGGDKLKAPAADSVQDYIASIVNLSREQGLFAIFDLKNDFPNEWYNANHSPAGATERVLVIDKLNEKLPLFTKGHEQKNIIAKDIYLYVPASLSALITTKSITMKQGVNDISFNKPGNPVGKTMMSFDSSDEAPMSDLQITIKDTKTVIDKMWLVERYVLS